MMPGYVNSTYVMRSEVHGDGLFAKRPVYHADLWIAENRYVETEDHDVREGCRLWDYLVGKGQGLVMMLGDMNMLNHSDDPNCRLEVTDGVVKLYSLRPIEEHEELTIKYSEVTWGDNDE